MGIPARGLLTALMFATGVAAATSDMLREAAVTPARLAGSSGGAFATDDRLLLPGPTFVESKGVLLIEVGDSTATVRLTLIDDAGRPVGEGRVVVLATGERRSVRLDETLAAEDLIGRRILVEVVAGDGRVHVEAEWLAPAERAFVVAASRRPSRHINTVPVNSALALEGVAGKIYDTLAASQDLRPLIGGVMTAFGVPPLGEADLAALESRFEGGFPLLFVPQVSEMVDAFTDGGLLTLDSFIAAANAQGARQKGTTNLLTRDYLTEEFAAFAGKSQYQTDEALPAFVLALGRERANRFPPATPDPLWGDGLLDPLQLTLMLYAVSYSSEAPLPAQAPLLSVAAFTPVTSLAGAANPVGGQIKGKVTGAVQSVVELPLKKKEAAQVSVCASLLLYGHKVTVTATPGLIYHRQPDGTAPWSTRLDALLTFQDDYWDNYAPIDRWLLEKAGNCTLPRRGSVEGKPVVFSVSDGLFAHGGYSVTPSVTDDDGKAVANWQAVVETTPVARRTFDNQRDAVGAAIVRVSSLVPGWSGLERVVGLLKDTGNTGDSPLTVMYYVDPCKGEASPGLTRADAVNGSQADATCVDSWSGTSSSTVMDYDPVYRMAAQVKWVPDPANSYGSTVAYYPEGVVSVEMLVPCISINPASFPVTHQDGYLWVHYDTSPPSWEGAATLLSGSTTQSSSCDEGSFPTWVGGAWFSGLGSTTAGGNEIMGTLSGGGQTYTFRFTRD